MEEEDRFGMKEFRENMMKMFPNLPLEILKDTEERLIKDVIAATKDNGQQHVLGSPLLDLLSVRVRLKIPPPPQGSWCIAGDIYYYNPPDSQRGITEPLSNHMFQKKAHNAQFLDPSDPFLTLDLASPIFDFFPDTHLCFKLLTKRRKCSKTQPLFEDSIHLDYTNYPDDMFDTVQLHDFKTSKVDLCVKYITYRAACTAKVHFSVDAPIGQKPRQLKVSGKIYASWSHTKGPFQPHLEHEQHCPCVCLFNSRSSLVTTGDPFQLFRSVATLPSYATLVLELVLSIDGVNCHHVLDFPAQDFDFTNMEFDVSGGFIGKIKLEWANEYVFEEEEDEEETGHQEKAKLTPPQVPKSICIHDTVLGKELVGNQMTEIFSIYVGANEKNTVYRVNGTIDVKDGWRGHRIFEMNEGKLTRKFVNGTTLPLIGPKRCLEGSCILQVHLKDEKGREFCRGYMGYNSSLLRRPWVDKLLCSIIKGELGFTEIHYVLFTSAVPCAVNVFLAAPSSCENVYIRGSIVCQYDIKYSTTFDRKHYRSFLFDEEEPMILEFGAERMLVNIPSPRSMHVKHNEHWISVPLSRSAVCVPTDNTLMIEVDISVECDSSNVSVEKLVGIMEFKIGRKTWQMISSDDYQMFATVDWA